MNWPLQKLPKFFRELLPIAGVSAQAAAQTSHRPSPHRYAHLLCSMCRSGEGLFSDPESVILFTWLSGMLSFAGRNYNDPSSAVHIRDPHFSCPFFFYSNSQIKSTDRSKMLLHKGSIIDAAVAAITIVGLGRLSRR